MEYDNFSILDMLTIDCLNSYYLTMVLFCRLPIPVVANNQDLSRGHLSESFTLCIEAKAFPSWVLVMLKRQKRKHDHSLI